MTPCEKLGYKIGQRFRYKGLFKVVGDVFLEEDDGTDVPPFMDTKDMAQAKAGAVPYPWFLELACVRPIIRVRAGTNEVIDV